jgi:hypothetical protein
MCVYIIYKIIILIYTLIIYYIYILIYLYIYITKFPSLTLNGTDNDIEWFLNQTMFC